MGANKSDNLHFIRPLLFLFFLLLSFCGNGQDTPSVPDSVGDTSVSPFVQRILNAAKSDRKRNEDAFVAGRVSLKQRAIWNELIRTAHEVKLYLNTAPDTVVVKKGLISAMASYEIVKDGIFTNKGSTQTERNLSVSSIVLSRLIDDISSKKKLIDQHSANLSRFRNRLDSLLSDTIIYTFPTDSVALVRYLNKLRVISKEGDPTDNALNQAMIDVDDLQNQIDALLLNLTASYDELESLRNGLANISFKRELPDIWGSIGHYRPLSEVLRYSYSKEKMAFAYYLKYNLNLIYFLIFATAALCAIHRIISRRVLSKNDVDADRLIVQHPFASAIFIVVSLSQFLFITAPFIFSICIWTIAIVCLILFARDYITAYWLRFWIIISILFLIACANNLILQATRTERWVMLALSLSGIVYGVLLLYSQHRNALKEKAIILFIRFLVVTQCLSVLLNVFGRYNSGKILLNIGYSGIVVGIVLIWLTRLLKEQLTLGARFFRNSDSKVSLLWLTGIGDKIPIFLYGVFGILWFIIVGRQFYLFNKIFIPVQSFLHTQRTIGSYHFSIDGIFLFLVIMLFSMLLSRIISFFADYRVGVRANGDESSKGFPIGSWILLARIIIISLGVFLAFAASGLPLDRLTIIFGALGVGIGLGLQSLVSNLVSGLIIAFEKPVNVGDLVEISGRTGHVRSIGFRSSILALTDGASLVVPNGDILNTHVVNWSLSKGIKKLKISVGVAYGSDLMKVKSILESVAAKSTGVLSVPKPTAVATKFSESAISFDLVFWTTLTNESSAMNNIIASIDESFKENGIVIPFPQTEIHWVGPSVVVENKQ